MQGIANANFDYLLFFWPVCNLFQIVEFIAVLLKTGNEVAENEMVNSGTIQRVIDLFFE